MFEYLLKFNETIYNRYLTLETNIKSKSNSFYDSWLDLLEEFLNYVFNCEKITHDKRMTCGQLLKDKTFNSFLITTLNYTDKELESIKLKVSLANDHKHNLEKSLSIDDIYKYLLEFYTISSRYAKYKKIKSITPITIDYYVSIFGKHQEEHETLEETIQDTKTIKQMLSVMDKENNGGYLRTPFDFRRFCIGALQLVSSLESKENFYKKKKLVNLLALFSTILILINIPLCIISFGFFDGFSILNIVWLIFLLFITIHVFKTKPVNDVLKRYDNSIYNFKINNCGLAIPGKKKLSYQIFYIITLIINIVLIALVFTEEFKVINLFISLIAFLVSISLIVHHRKLIDFEDDFAVIYVANYWNGEKIEYIYDSFKNMYYLKDTIDEKFSVVTECLNEYFKNKN